MTTLWSADNISAMNIAKTGHGLFRPMPPINSDALLDNLRARLHNFSLLLVLTPEEIATQRVGG
jgi:hypothetical protein